MDNPSDNSWRILDWVLSACGGLIMLFMGLLKSKIDDDARAVHTRIKDTNAMIEKHDEIFSRLFAKIDHMSQRSEDRHVEILGLLHQELNKKADK